MPRSHMRLPIVLTEQDSGVTKVVDALSIDENFTKASRGGSKLMIWRGDEGKSELVRETPKQIQAAILKAYKQAGITQVPGLET